MANELERLVVALAGRRSRRTWSPEGPTCEVTSSGKFWKINFILGSSCISFASCGWAALQAGHSKSPNSTMVTAASAGPWVRPAGRLQNCTSGGKWLGAKRNHVAGQSEFLVGRHEHAKNLLSLRRIEDRGDFSESRSLGWLDAQRFSKSSPGSSRTSASGTNRRLLRSVLRR